MLENPTKALFSDFGQSFQEKIFHALFTDKQWAAQMCEVIKFEYFELKYIKFLVERFFAYHTRYKTFPTLDALVMIVKEDLNTTSDQVLKSQVVESLIRVRDGVDTDDFPFVKEKALDFCKQQAFKDALEQAVDLIATEKYDTVVDVVKRAMTAGSPSTPGHNFFEDREARFVRINRRPVPTGMDKLDAQGILNGGLGRGELGIIVGNTGTGKCTIGDTYIQVQYEAVVIEGVEYAPWEKLQTTRGLINACDVKLDDELVDM